MDHVEENQKVSKVSTSSHESLQDRNDEDFSLLVADTDSPPPVADTDSPPPVVDTHFSPPVVDTDSPPPVVDTDSPTPVVDTDVSPPVVDTDSPPPVADTDLSPPVAGTDLTFPVTDTDLSPPVADKDLSPQVTNTEKSDGTLLGKNSIENNFDSNDNDGSNNEFKNSFSSLSHDKEMHSEQIQDMPKDVSNSYSADTAESASGKGKKSRKSRKNRFKSPFSCFGKKHSSTDSESEEDVPPEQIERFKNDKKTDFEYFWQSYSPFSQWYKVRMTVDNKEYNCAEQFMMEQKAILMGDQESADLIMALDEPREQKSVGREVKNWNQDLWDQHCSAIIKKGNLEKFRQNKELMGELILTYPKILVEASPYDTVWGIGLRAEDWRAHNRAYWKGKNLLGYILTEVRDQLMEEEGMIGENIPTEMSSDYNVHSSPDKMEEEGMIGENIPTEMSSDYNVHSSPDKMEEEGMIGENIPTEMSSDYNVHSSLDKMKNVQSENQEIKSESACNANMSHGKSVTDNRIQTGVDVETTETKTCSDDYEASSEQNLEVQPKIEANVADTVAHSPSNTVNDEIETRL